MRALTALIGMVGLAVALTGCQPSDSTPTDSTSEATTPATDKPTLEETVTETAEAAKKVASDVNDKAQEILTQAQNLVGEKKYEEAGNLLQKLGDFELTEEQQKMLDDLTATIQKALESEAVKQGTKAIGNLLGGEE